MPKPVPTDAACSAARERLERRLDGLGAAVRVRSMLRVGSGSRPDVAFARIGQVDCVVKDHQGCDRWFALWLGPMLARREVRALRRLESIDGVPRVLRVFDRRAFAMSRLDATPYRARHQPVDAWRDFFAAMDGLVASMHACGVAHGDLRSPDNTLMTPDGRPAVVDFVASYTRGASWNPWSHWIFARLCGVDRSAIEKQKRTVCPSLLDDDPAAPRGEGVVGSLARAFGVAVRRIARRLFTDGERR